MNRITLKTVTQWVGFRFLLRSPIIMETILIVDDEKNYLVVLEALLGAEGYEIITAGDAKAALSIIREADLDLVVTDMKMPG